MTRKELATIIKARSIWKIDRRKGDYRLPSGNRLSEYVYDLVESQLALDNLGILANGNMAFLKTDLNNEQVLMPPFKPNEKTTQDEQAKRIEQFVNELIR